MAWRLAKSLETLRDQINTLAPDRSKASDGTIGDAAHSSRTSDHNPNSQGIVCAIDITHDPRNGINAGAIVETIRVSKDPRIKYLIWNRKISNPDISGGAWRPYGGSNPHDKHFHLSVRGSVDSTKPWSIGSFTQEMAAPVIREQPILKFGSSGELVRKAQRLLKIDVTGVFDKKMEGLVMAYQKRMGFTKDGKIGPQTWGGLDP